MSFIPAKKETNSTTQKGKLSICLATILTRPKKNHIPACLCQSLPVTSPPCFFFAARNAERWQFRAHQMPSPSWCVSSWWVARKKKPPTWWLPVSLGGSSPEWETEGVPTPPPSYLGSHILIDSEHVLRQNAKHLFPQPTSLPSLGRMGDGRKKTRVFNLLLKLPPSPWNRVLPGWEEFTRHTHTHLWLHTTLSG